MDDRHRAYGSPAESREDTTGWVIAGEEEGWAQPVPEPGRHGWPGPSWRRPDPDQGYRDPGYHDPGWQEAPWRDESPGWNDPPPAPAAPAYPEPGHAAPGYREPRHPAHGYAGPGYYEPEYADPGYAEPGYAGSGYGPGSPEPGSTEPGYPEPQYADPQHADPRYTAPEYPEPGYAEPGYAEPGYAAPGYPEAGYAEPAYPDHPGSAVPGRSGPDHPGYRLPRPEPERRDTGWVTTGEFAAPAPEEEPPPDRFPEASRATVAAWTISFFSLPALIYLLWAFTRSATPPPYCVGGTDCPAPRTEALTAFLDNLPALAGAVALAVAVSTLMRRVTRVWRPGTVGFAAAVIGAGLATLVVSILR